MLQRTSSRLVLCLLALPSLRRSEYRSTSVLRASGHSSTKTSCTSATKISTYSSASAMRCWRRRSFSLCSLTIVSTTLAKRRPSDTAIPQQQNAEEGTTSACNLARAAAFPALLCTNVCKDPQLQTGLSYDGCAGPRLPFVVFGGFPGSWL